MAIKEKLIMKQSFKRGNLVRPHAVTQNMDHLSASHLVREIEIREAGIVERDGKQYLFQTVRLLIEELPDIGAGSRV